MPSLKESLSSQPANRAVFTIAANATGGGDMIVALDGKTATINPGAADTPTVSGVALDAALVVALGSSYTISNAAGVVTVVGPGGRLVGVAALCTDTTQSITVDSAEWGERNAALQTTAGQTSQTTPAAEKRGDGLALAGRAVTNSASEGCTVLVRALLANTSGGAKTARYRLMCRRGQGGWYAHPTFGTRTITSAAANGFTEDIAPPVQLFGVEEVLPQLLDDGAAGDLADCALHLWAATS